MSVEVVALSLVIIMFAMKSLKPFIITVAHCEILKITVKAKKKLREAKMQVSFASPLKRFAFVCLQSSALELETFLCGLKTSPDL